MTEKDTKIALWMFMMLIGGIILLMVQATLIFSYDHKDEKQTDYVQVEDEIPTINVTTWLGQINVSSNNTFKDYDSGDIVFLKGNVTKCTIATLELDEYGIQNSKNIDIKEGTVLIVEIQIYTLNGHEQMFINDISLEY